VIEQTRRDVSSFYPKRLPLVLLSRAVVLFPDNKGKDQLDDKYV
jgi:hypothetical protein